VLRLTPLPDVPESLPCDVVRHINSPIRSPPPNRRRYDMKVPGLRHLSALLKAEGFLGLGYVRVSFPFVDRSGWSGGLELF
jgi:hypothetical protein